MIKMSLLNFTIRKRIKIHFFKFLSTSHQILDFLIAKLLSKLQINTSLEKNSKLSKNNRGKKPKKILKKSNYLTKKSTNWTPRLLSCPELIQNFPLNFSWTLIEFQLSFGSISVEFQLNFLSICI